MEKEVKTEEEKARSVLDLSIHGIDGMKILVCLTPYRCLSMPAVGDELAPLLPYPVLAAVPIAIW